MLRKSYGGRINHNKLAYFTSLFVSQLRRKGIACRKWAEAKIIIAGARPWAHAGADARAGLAADDIILLPLPKSQLLVAVSILMLFKPLLSY